LVLVPAVNNGSLHSDLNPSLRSPAGSLRRRWKAGLRSCDSDNRLRFGSPR